MFGSRTKKPSWFAQSLLFGLPLAVALAAFWQTRHYATASWFVCLSSTLAARFVGRTLAGPTHSIERTFVETMVRMSVPLSACVLAGVYLPLSQARVVAAYHVVFFTWILAVDRVLLVAQLTTDKPASNRNADSWVEAV